MAQALVVNRQFAVAQTSLQVTVASRLDDIKALEPDWRALERAVASDMTLFQGFDWNWRWCKNCLSQDHQIVEGKKPHIIVVRHENQAVAIWPLQIQHDAKITIMDWLSTPALQYGDALLHPDFDAGDLCLAAWQAITRIKGVDLVRLGTVAETSPIHGFLDARCSKVSDTRAFNLNLRGFGDAHAYHASLKKSTRRARRKRLHKLERAGTIAFGVHDGPTEVGELAERAIAWKRTWLKERNWPTGLMDNDCFKNFMGDLGRSSGNRRCRWVAGALRLDGEPIAIEVGAVYGKHYYSYLGAFDGRYRQFSPGKIELEAMIHWAVDSDIDAFDFLAVPSQYKNDWTDNSIAVSNFTHVASFRGQLLHSVWIKRLRPAVKYSLQRLPVAHRKMILSLIPD